MVSHRSPFTVTFFCTSALYARVHKRGDSKFENSISRELRKREFTKLELQKIANCTMMQLHYAWNTMMQPNSTKWPDATKLLCSGSAGGKRCHDTMQPGRDS
eukprot:g26249.t1